jgi:hypothetical protein
LLGLVGMKKRRVVTWRFAYFSGYLVGENHLLFLVKSE